MATAWSEIIRLAMVRIEDVRWNDELSISPAIFYRAKSDFVQSAIPMLNQPPKLLLYIQTGLVSPRYESAEWTSTPESTEAEATVRTGITGYELCSVSQMSPDGNTMTQTSIGSSYDAETGEITFPVQTEAGISYSIDFYTDGQFQELSVYMKNLLAMATAVVWDERFNRNWLDMKPKIKDSSFQTINEANFMSKTSERLQNSRMNFYGELRRYEDTCSYLASIPEAARISASFGGDLI